MFYNLHIEPQTQCLHRQPLPPADDRFLWHNIFFCTMGLEFWNVGWLLSGWITSKSSACSFVCVNHAYRASVSDAMKHRGSQKR